MADDKQNNGPFKITGDARPDPELWAPIAVNHGKRGTGLTLADGTDEMQDFTIVVFRSTVSGDMKSWQTAGKFTLKDLRDGQA